MMIRDDDHQSAEFLFLQVIHIAPNRSGESNPGSKLDCERARKADWMTTEGTLFHPPCIIH